MGTVPVFRMHNIGTISMFKMHNVGTPKMYDLCLELEFRLYGRNKWPLVAPVFLLESSRPHFLGLPLPIQSGTNCMDKECTLQKVPLEKLVPGCVPQYFFFNLCHKSTIFWSPLLSSPPPHSELCYDTSKNMGRSFTVVMPSRWKICKFRAFQRKSLKFSTENISSPKSIFWNIFRVSLMILSIKLIYLIMTLMISVSN